ncbi:YnbE family lipoprotein [Sphingomonas sp. GB1N7]|uniref:YnbE family lipoprotein n=1 Tax=Parasphingomonas caseinilytica TaxID=3096158 RepID=UPI002FCC215F
MTASVQWRRTFVVVGLIATSTGCVNVSAPDKPIEINLNINVKQEVVYRLDGEAKATIKAQPGIF